MAFCPEHAELTRQMSRLAACAEAVHEDMQEVKADLKGTNKLLHAELTALLRANGARREAIGELRGRLLMWVAATSLLISVAVALVVRLVTQ